MSESSSISEMPSRHSTAQQLLRTLTKRIEAGRYAVGMLLPAERKLAEQFGVSRVVVREVAKMLEQRGLISIRQGVGVRVTNNRALPIQDSFFALLPEEKMRLRQCAQARVLIEPELAKMAANGARREELVPKLQEIQKQLAGKSDIAQAALLDIAFHDTVAEMAGNKVLALMLASVAELGRRSREHTLTEFGVKRAYDFHQRILAALEAGDPKAARKAMKDHLTAALGDLI